MAANRTNGFFSCFPFARLVRVQRLWKHKVDTLRSYEITCIIRHGFIALGDLVYSNDMGNSFHSLSIYMHICNFYFPFVNAYSICLIKKSHFLVYEKLSKLE